MVAVALVVAVLSYGVFYYGLALVEGQTIKFGTVIIPGRYQPATAKPGVPAKKAA